jgi:hypothetical protein
MTIRRFLAKRYKAKSLDDVMHAIGGLVRANAADPHVIKLARQITSGTVDWDTDRRTGELVPVVVAWGRPYRAPAGPICKTRDDKCELEAIWDFVVMNVRYVLDPPHVDTYPDVRYTLEAGAEDCDGFTIVFASLAMAVGFDTAARIISQSGEAWEHIYPLVGVPKGHTQAYFPMDATEPGKWMGWEYPNAAKQADYRL